MKTEEEIKEKKNVHHGKVVSHLRRAMNYTQGYVAEVMHVSQQGVSKLEQQEKIDRSILEKLAVIFEVPVKLIENFEFEEEGYNFSGNDITVEKGGIANIGINNEQKVDGKVLAPLDTYLELSATRENLLIDILKVEQERCKSLEEQLIKSSQLEVECRTLKNELNRIGKELEALKKNSK